jgi:hypothetical protein
MQIAPDIATCMYYTWIDPFTKKEAKLRKGMRSRKMQRALMQFFKPENYFPPFAVYPFQTHSMACGRNCDWALPMPWLAPRQNRYWYS